MCLPSPMDHPGDVEAGERAEVTEIEDVLDRLEVWHRASTPASKPDDDRSEAAARR